MTTLRERLTEVFMKQLKESHENSKEMIASNSTSFDEMGMSHTTPGEFSQEEITDPKNLENTGSMANDTDFEGKVSVEGDSECPACAVADKVDDVMNDLASDIVDISVKDDEIEDDEDENHDNEEEEDEDEKKLMSIANESVQGSLKKAFEGILKEAKGDDYAGPQDFVPDSRINASAVLNALKKEIGEGSEGIHVDQDQNNEDEKVWIVTQIDEEKLPKTIDVINVKLERDGNKYKVKEMRKDFPAMK